MDTVGWIPRPSTYNACIDRERPMRSTAALILGFIMLGVPGLWMVIRICLRHRRPAAPARAGGEKKSGYITVC